MHQQAGAHGTEAEPDPASGELEQIPAFVAAALYPQSQPLLAPMPKDAPAVPSSVQTQCAAKPLKAPA